MQLLRARHIQKGLVNRNGLHQRCQRQHMIANLATDGDIMVHARPDHYSIGTAFQCLPCRHR